MHGSMSAYVLYALFVLWATLVGVSVSVQVVASVQLLHGSSATENGIQSFYIGTISVTLGGLLLLPRSLYVQSVWNRPSRWWALMGGLLNFPAFMAVRASKLFGTQIVLLVQLCGLLCTGLLLDHLENNSRSNKMVRCFGLILVMFGVTLDGFQQMASGSQETPIFSLDGLIYLGGTLLSGVGFGLMPKCNNVLTKDFGSSARATMVSALVFTIAYTPALIGIWLGTKIEPPVHAGSATNCLWWCIVCGQSAFYIGSMAKLPVVLGYTATFCILLAGQLSSSALIDAFGFAGVKICFNWVRAIALFLVISGATMSSHQKQDPRNMASYSQNVGCERALNNEHDTESAQSPCASKSGGQ